MLRRAFALLLLLFAFAALAAGCGDDEGSDDNPSLTSEEPTEGPPGVTTGAGGGDDPLETAAFERGYSECASRTLEDLAGTYNIDPDEQEVAQRVGVKWAREFDEEQVGPLQRAARAGCLQAFAQK